MRKSASKAQFAVARKLGINIDKHSFAVAAAQIETALAPVLTDEPRAEPATASQVAFASSLGIDTSNDSKKVAFVRIQECLEERNSALVKQKGLAPGVKVIWKQCGREMTISSISQNGRLWFKGGNGYGAFPDQVERV